MISYILHGFQGSEVGSLCGRDVVPKETFPRSQMTTVSSIFMESQLAVVSSIFMEFQGFHMLEGRFVERKMKKRSVP